MSEEDGDKKSSIKLFRFGERKVGQIPCFRKSLMYGIGGGLGTGLAHFMFTSNVKKSTNIAFGSYIGITLLTWCCCRYKWTMQRFENTKIQRGMQEKIIYENTELEKTIEQQTKDV